MIKSLGTLIENSEYEINLEDFNGKIISTPNSFYQAIIKEQILLIKTSSVKSLHAVCLRVLLAEKIQEISFSIVPNLFEISCQTIDQGVL